MSDDQHILMYLDILGYENAINKKDPKKLEILLGIVQRLASQKSDYFEKHESIKDGRVSTYYPAISTFSDHVVVSVPVTTPRPRFDAPPGNPDIFGAIFILAKYATSFCRDALSNGFLVRGGIGIGNLFHDKGVVFGEALVEAVKIEESISFYPRIIASNKIIEALTLDHGNPLAVDMLQQCSDGLFHLDWSGSSLFSKILEEQGLSPENEIKTLGDKIDSELKALEVGTNANAKWMWMKNHFTESTKRHLA